MLQLHYDIQQGAGSALHHESLLAGVAVGDFKVNSMPADLSRALTSTPCFAARSAMMLWKVWCHKRASSALLKARVVLSVSLIMCRPLWILKDHCNEEDHIQLQQIYQAIKQLFTNMYLEDSTR